MVKYHPDTRYLTEYAAGSLARSLALCVSVHLHYCPVCRTRVRDLTALGAELFAALEPREVDEEAFERLNARLDAAPDVRVKPSSARPAAPAVSVLPPPIRKLTHGGAERLKWRQLGKSTRY